MPGIKAATRDRVLELARELNYTPSRFARGLVQGSHVSVGLAIPDLSNPYFPAFASSVVEQATARGWHVVVDDFGHGGRTALDAVERVAPQVDAVIGYLGSDAERALSLMAGRPLVVLDYDDALFGGGSISFDYVQAAATAVGYLQQAGRRNIAYLDSPAQPDAPSARGGAFAALLPVGAVRAASESPEAAAQVTEVLLHEAPDIDAIVVFNDLMAAGVLKALARVGRRVPEACAVIGMDGIPLGELVTPALTTMALDLREVGRTAVELLDGLITGEIRGGTPEARRTIRHELLLRDSA